MDENYIGAHLSKNIMKLMERASSLLENAKTARPGWVQEIVSSQARAARRREELDEEALGSCLSSGRGFMHVNSSVYLEPCPFAPYPDINLRDTPLKEALKSELLARIRENHHMLEETRGGCGLWENREWVRGLLE